MFRKVINMSRRRIFYLCFGRRNIFLVLGASIFFIAALSGCHLLSVVGTSYLMPPEPPDQNLQHFMRSRSLKHYFDNIQLLIEPSTVVCETEVSPVVVMVTSSPPRHEHRQAVRNTWAKHQPTYFILGLKGDNADEQMVDNYVEAKQYRDMVVFDLKDHYQNLTLKTALMMKWVSDRCPHASYMLKTDDDVLVNPWKLQEVVNDRPNEHLIGYKRVNNYIHRDEYNKWYMPRWLCYEDVISEYLEGNAYLIKVKYMKAILEAAYHVPLLNLEDVYFTHFVAQRRLGLNLTHDHRFNPYRPWLPLACAPWKYATVHSFKPYEMDTFYSRLTSIADVYKKDTSVCSFYNNYIHSDIYFY